MKLRKKRVATVGVVVGAGLSAGLLIGTVSGVAFALENPSSESISDGREVITGTDIRAVKENRNIDPASIYSVNRNGQTYGSGTEVAKTGVPVDLEAAIATNGKKGFVSREDAIGGPMPTTEEEVEEWNRRSEKDRTIPVYESDGVTVIGEFLMQGSGETVVNGVDKRGVAEEIRVGDE